jgi:hypothetical protein
MTIESTKAARRILSARLESYVATVKEQLSTDSGEFWKRVEPNSPIVKS